MAKEFQPVAERRSEEYTYYFSVSEPTTVRNLVGYTVTEQKSTHYSAKGLLPLKLDSVPVIVVAEQRVALPGINEQRASEMRPNTHWSKPPIANVTVFTMAWHDRLEGIRFNQLMLALSKDPHSFGLDYGDILTDWGALYRKEHGSGRVLKLHEDLGRPWWVLNHYGLGQLDAINYDLDAFHLPLLRWWIDGKGNRRIIHSNVMLTQEGNDAVNSFLADIVPQDFTDTGNERGPGDTVAGLYYLAYCSPLQWAGLPRSMDLPRSYEREIGATQVPLFVTRGEETFVKSPVLPAAEAHVGFAA